MALAFPPLPFAFLLLVAFVPLLTLVEIRHERRTQDPAEVMRPRRLFALLYVSFLIWNFGTCYWLMLTAFQVESAGEAVEAFVAGLLAVGLNPILMSLPWLLYAALRRRLSRPVALGGWALAWVAFEHLHLNWDLTWSWLNLAHGFTMFPSYLQYLEFTGTGGTALHVMASNALLFELACRLREGRPLKRGGWAWGAWALLPWLLYPLIVHTGRDVFKPVGQLGVRVVQPNIDPYVKFDEQAEEEQLRLFLQLASQEPIQGTDLVVLPETALPNGVWHENLRYDPQIVPFIELSYRERLSVLLGLVYRRQIREGGPVPAHARSFGPDGSGPFFETFNAATMAGDTLAAVKGKLVPFVERAPFMKQMKSLNRLNIDLGGGFGSFGLPDSLITLPTRSGAEITPVICYESEFGEWVRTLVGRGGQLICIITNDGWFGNSSGHRQHAYLATLRAIENRRAVARCANTGMSLTMDNRGYINQTLGWWERGVIDEKMPLYVEPTFYMRYGDYMGRTATLLSALFLLLALVNRRWVERAGFRLG